MQTGPRTEVTSVASVVRPALSLHVDSRPPQVGAPGAAVVVLVHGSLERGESFRRVQRRLPDLTTVTYDRRGYQRSRAAGPAGIEGHVDDLVAVAEAFRPTGAPVVAVGHSYGGTVALGAALAAPDLIAAVGAYEPPLPWLGFRRPPPSAAGTDPDPGEEAERFFRRMVGDESWARLSPAEQASRRADGVALTTELASLRAGEPFDLTALRVPAVIGRGGSRSLPHHRRGAAWLAAHIPSAELHELETASHGAHLSHPDGFAALVRRVVASSAQPG